MKYRTDIDSLRAIAVLSVVLFHAGVPGITGGYVGVDIFFVISGYLITTLIWSDISAGKFSIARFYERRIRRIFPALFLVIAATLIGGLFILLPADLDELAASVVAATVFVSNIFFWDQSGYFDGPAELKPLLHTWSLAVEEQYYILFPIFLIILGRFRRGAIPYVAIVTMAVLSFILSVWAVENKPVAAFYWAPTRAWELLLGAVLAFGTVPNIKKDIWRELIAALGLVLMVGSFVVLTPETPFPGLAAAPACVGAMMYIHAHQNGLSVTGRLLSWRPVVFVGLISYSLYLWHWPLFVYARYINIEPLTPMQCLGLVAVSAALATLSWHYVEKPFRRRRLLAARRSVFVSGGVAMAFAAVCGVAVVLLHGLPNRLPDRVLAVIEAGNDMGSDRQCHQVYAYQRETLCVRGATAAEPAIILIGDSHAGAIAEGVFEAADQSGLSGYQLTDAGYSPTYTFTKWGEVGKFRYMNRRLIEALDDNPDVRLVVIVVHWTQAVLDNEYFDADGHRVSGSVAVFEGIKALSERYPDRAFLLMEAPPYSPLFGWHVRAREALFDQTIDADVTVAEYAAIRSSYADVLERLDGLPNVVALQIEPYICNETICPARMDDGTLFYRDDNHLSLAGSHLLIPLFNRYFTSWRITDAEAGLDGQGADAISAYIRRASAR